MICRYLRMIKEIFFLVLCVTIFPEKAKNKIKQSRDQDDFVLMMTIHKAKSPTQVHFHLGRDKRIFEKYKTSKQTYHLNKRVVEGTSTATQVQLTFPCVNIRYHDPVVG